MKNQALYGVFNAYGAIKYITKQSFAALIAQSLK
jgi:hypothetical protein